MINKIETHILTLSCKDQIGIVAKISSMLAKFKCNIVESKQFTDTLNGNFFIRQSFTLFDQKKLADLTSNLVALSSELNAEFLLSEIENKMSTILLVSKFDHCLNDLLFRVRNKSLSLNIKAIISNHNVAEEIAKFSNIPFYYLPVEKENKIEQEKEIKKIIYENEVQLIVLARYMQVLSENFTNEFEGKIINIHHSFLPSFKGAKPYHQAFERGVKVIGATAHYVTKDLDEGPIIEQDTQEVDHEMMPNDLVSIGRDIESRVLYRALKAHSERRVFLNGKRTIVFKGHRKVG
ncbi:MAG: formyltetrahydrofolate deformylase [Alphaproteobacteria bacterium]|jgi:formyltetrahydrofolate deformylase|nr:formyltetrahydrofolate deformylase [Alphaproteobacteria bacterium]MBL6851032.1 formyltetrahydrofolate deformylase [Alphaproteobacteria bacterium]